jgi:aspartate racemase
MEDDFYRGRLTGQFGLEVMVPNTEDREAVHRIIYEELCLGTIRPESRAQMGGIMSRLVQMGAEGIILGCTELGLLIGAEDCRVPLFDTTRVHALAAVEQALKEHTNHEG